MNSTAGNSGADGRSAADAGVREQILGRVPAAELAAELTSAGVVGPVLLVAQATSIARLAPIWAAAFDAAGFVHRVRLFDGESSRREIAAIVLEGQSLGAHAVVGVGTDTVIDASRAAATLLCVPFISSPAG